MSSNDPRTGIEPARRCKAARLEIKDYKPYSWFMNDELCFALKLMVLRTINVARLQPRGGMHNDSWRVLVGFLTPFEFKGVRNQP